jgi:hypothetical protein
MLKLRWTSAETPYHCHIDPLVKHRSQMQPASPANPDHLSQDPALHQPAYRMDHPNSTAPATTSAVVANPNQVDSEPGTGGAAASGGAPGRAKICAMRRQEEGAECSGRGLHRVLDDESSHICAQQAGASPLLPIRPQLTVHTLLELLGTFLQHNRCSLVI